jgi:hypothetical protein
LLVFGAHSIVDGHDYETTTRGNVMDKVIALRLKRAKGWMYFIRGGNVWRVPVDDENVADPNQVGEAELVRETAVEQEPGYLYFLDADGDIARARRVPNMRGRGSRRIPAPAKRPAVELPSNRVAAWWIVKGDPSQSRNSFDEMLVPGKLGSWSTKKPSKHWKAGDGIFFWASAPAMCVVGLGELTGQTELEDDGHTRFGVRYLTDLISQPLYKDELERDAVLADASFLKSGPATTVLSLPRDQAHRLAELVANSEPAFAPVCLRWFPSIGDVAGSAATVDPPTNVAEQSDDSIDSELSAFEGAERTRMVVHRLRERRLRSAKIAAFKRANGGRLFCEVPGCGFCFEDTYGEAGRDFAHVHHLKPLAESDGAATTLDDLAVVCPNCHAMVHAGGECRPLGNLIVKMRQSMNAATSNRGDEK